jgi:AmmeMemoRadiSam system protein B
MFGKGADPDRGKGGEAVRAPAVAGLFYPGSAVALERDVDSRLRPVAGPKRCPLAVLSPHAGYVYSGSTAGLLFASIEIPGRVLLLGPNHTGLGAPLSVSPASRWTTPLGGVEVDEELRSRLLEELPGLELDPLAHLREHSLEVQLPFLQRLEPSFRMVPIILPRLTPSAAAEIGRRIARVIRSLGEPVLVVASSDMNHYESQAVTMRKDEIALDRFLALDGAGLCREVVARDISMCGYIPACVAIAASLELGAARTELLDHRTSGDVSGDTDEVVGYASALVA